MNQSSSILRIVLGNQLFPLTPATHPTDRLYFMAESRDLCAHYIYHQHKIVLFLANMRAYANELRARGCRIEYSKLEAGSGPSFIEKLDAFLKQHEEIREVEIFEIEDKFFESALSEFFSGRKIEMKVLESPMFLSNRGNFKAYLKSSKRPFMKTFYERERKRVKVLVQQGQPVGGKWSFDEENRQALDTKIAIPDLPSVSPSRETKSVIELVSREFAKHPGRADQYWMPATREEWLSWLKVFIDERLEKFGPYQDALSTRKPFLFHSVISPALNMGVLTPREVVRLVEDAFHDRGLPLNSVEGFIRQVIGWREFIRGVYQNFSTQEESSNFWGHQKKLSPHWYEGNFGIPPLDEAIAKSLRWGYLHHIERLMVVGNMMTLLEIHPHEAHRWFMELFVDSSDWVMGPNVYGMALFSDGGIFATKPYICGSNYYRKMGKYPAGDWCEAVDGLYWGFIEKHAAFFKKNPRLSMMVRTLEKMDPSRRKAIYAAAEEFKNRLWPAKS